MFAHEKNASDDQTCCMIKFSIRSSFLPSNRSCPIQETVEYLIIYFHDLSNLLKKTHPYRLSLASIKDRKLKLQKNLFYFLIQHMMCEKDLNQFCIKNRLQAQFSCLKILRSEKIQNK